MSELVATLKVLSDQIRLRMLNLLLQRECCVCEVMQALDISQTRASRNLTMLYSVGLLKLRKEGLWSLYSIDWDAMDANTRDIIKAAHKAFTGDRQMEADLRQLKKALRVGVSCVNKSCNCN